MKSTSCLCSIICKALFRHAESRQWFTMCSGGSGKQIVFEQQIQNQSKKKVWSNRSEQILRFLISQRLWNMSVCVAAASLERSPVHKFMKKNTSDSLICLVKEELCRFFSQLLLAAIIHVSVTKQTTREENNHFPTVTHQCVNWSQWRSFLSARRLNFSFYFNPIARISVGTYGVLAFLQSSENFVLLIWLS